MNRKSIFFYIGLFTLLISLFSILNILYSIYFDFFLGLNSYIITLILSLSIGTLFCYIGRNDRKNFDLVNQITFIILSFLFLPLLISIPYFLSIYNISFLNAYFESISGFTTTGFSILSNIEMIDEPLLLWRSSSQWIGGLFFLFITIGTIGSRQIKIKPAYLISGGASGRNFYNNFNHNFIKIISIYFFTTLLVIFLYTLFNIRLLDSFNLAFTTISSGGFIPTTELSDIVNSRNKIFILSITLLIPILNFFLFFNLITKKFSFKDHQEDFHLILLVFVFTAIIYLFIKPNENVINLLFYVTSSISTSGISTYSSSYDSSLYFIVLAIVGGSLISTSSGLKYTRFYILLKTSYQEIYRLFKPLNIIDKNLYNSETKINDQDFKIAFLVFIFFIFSTFILSSILAFDFLEFENSFKLALLTLANTTNSSLYGIESLNFIDLNDFTKMSLILFMIIGKIELIAVLYLIKKIIFKE